jgi:hypothetical protein
MVLLDDEVKWKLDSVCLETVVILIQDHAQFASNVPLAQKLF